MNAVQSYPNLQILVGTAISDSDLCNRLLRGDRSQAIARFDLTEAEREIVLATEADTLQEFAQALLDWMGQENGSHTRIDGWAYRNSRLSRLFVK
jgi:hypothetical protein